MCVIAAYLGDKPAAPILLEMLEREEGLGGGFYTGVATVHEGKLHYAKVVGDVKALREQTDALELPGTLGIAHSRTPSGGGREWAHPFIGNAETMAYVANGAVGAFSDTTDYVRAGNLLLDRGYHFRSGVPEAVGNYPMLQDGNSVHVSEVMCLQIEEYLREGSDLLEAGARTFQDWPSEIVGLTISADVPDSFVGLRINQPLVLGHSDSAIYGATTEIAFPEGTQWRMVMPGNCAGRFSLSSFSLHPLTQIRIPAGPPPALAAAVQAVTPVLQVQGVCGLGSLCKAATALRPEGHLGQEALVAYQAIHRLLQQGKVELVTERVPGMFGEGTVPRTRVKWIAEN